MNALSISDFVGIWRTETACIQYRDDGTFETLHSPSRGKFQVIRDSECPGLPVKSPTGFVLIEQFDLPAFGLLRRGHVHLIESFTKGVVVTRLYHPEGKTEPITLRRD